MSAAYRRQAVFPPPIPHSYMVLTSRCKSSQWSGVEAERQLTGKYNLPKTRVANSSVDLDPQIDNTVNYSASTPSPSHPNTLHLTHVPAEGTPIQDPVPLASIHGPFISA